MIKPLLAFAVALLLSAPAAATGIEEASYVRIGGIDQWVTIRGDDREKPILLVVHGGPAEAQSPFLSLYAPYEKRFVVVNWDQRGAGRTFARLGQATPEVNLERIARDGIEVAEHVRSKLGRGRVVVMGHSWGSLVALSMVKQRPEIFRAYVGTGQFVSWPAIVEGQRDFALVQARAKGDEAAAAQLAAMGPADFADMRRYGQIQPWVSQGMPASDRDYIAKQRTLTAAAGGQATGDAADPRNGGEFSIPKLMPFVFGTDARTLGPDWPVPMFVIQGADDRTTPAPVAKAWLETIKAPAKRYVSIEGGHFAYMSNPNSLLDALEAALGSIR